MEWVPATGVSTEEKKVSRVAFSWPTAPALLNTRMRPLTPPRNWVGPTAPMLSGGTNWESAASVAPVKLLPTESFGPVASAAPSFVSGVEAGESGFGRRCRSASSSGRSIRACEAPFARCSSMIADVVRSMPGAPVQGCPTSAPGGTLPPSAMAPPAAMTSASASPASTKTPQL